MTTRTLRSAVGVSEGSAAGIARRSGAVGAVTLGVITLALLVMLGRVAQLQLAPSAALAEHIDPRVSVRSELAQRGDLLDRTGRVLAVTRFGQRIVVDPTLLPKGAALDEAIMQLAEVSGIDADSIGTRIHWALDENTRRVGAEDEAARPGGLRGLIHRVVGPGEKAAEDAAEEPDAEGEKAKGPIRYLPIGRVLADDRAQAVRAWIKDRRDQAKKDKSRAFDGVSLERRPVREYPGGGDVASLIGLVGFEDAGLLGAELRMDMALQGEGGAVKYVRDSAGRPLWIEPGQVEPANPGEDVRLSIDLELQRLALEELTRGVEEADAAGGRLVLVDPLTGEVLALADVRREVPGLAEYPWVDAPKVGPGAKAGAKAVVREPDVLAVQRRYRTLSADHGREKLAAMARNRCVEDVYEPGSTFKPFVWAGVTELGLARADEEFDTENGRWHTSYGRYIEDVTKRATMTWREVLINSSNIGMIKAAERMTPVQLHGVVSRFGFGKPTDVGLPGEASGIVTSLRKWSKYTHTSVAYGHEVAVTPVQMARAFSAFCRPGELAGTLPQLRLLAVGPRSSGENGSGPRPEDYQRGVVVRVLPSDVAILTRQTMMGVADNVELRMTGEAGPTPKAVEKAAKMWRFTMFGKSGTAEIPLGKAPKDKKRPRGSSGYFDGQYNSSFLAGAPVESPRLVCLVVIDDPGPAKIAKKEHYGARVAGPVVRRVMERALTYLNVAPSPGRGELRPIVDAKAE